MKEDKILFILFLFFIFIRNVFECGIVCLCHVDYYINKEFFYPVYTFLCGFWVS